MTTTSFLAFSPAMAGRPRISWLASQTSPWLVSWPLIVGMSLFVLLLNATGLPLLADPDSRWHVAVGKWILEHGTVPRVDSYSHTFAGQPWIAKEWLSQILLALAERGGGWGGVAALSAASIAVTFALMLRLLLRDLRPLPALLFTVAAIVLSSPHFLARPHVFAFPFLVLWVAGLVRASEQGRAPKPLLLLAMLLWANLHGGFTLGLMLCGFFALEAVVTAANAAQRRFLFVEWLKFGVAAVLVACITPYGPESMLVTLRIFGLGEALSLIKEWQSPDFQNLPMQELMLLAAIFGALACGLKLPVLRLLLVLGFLHLFLKHARNIELMAVLTPLVVAPILARQWPSLRPDSSAFLARPAGRSSTTLALSFAALFAACMIKLANIQPPTDTTPVAALEFAQREKLQGRVFNDYDFGGFLIHAGVPTFIDGRGELFGGDFIKRYADAVKLRGDDPLGLILDRHGIEWTLLANDQPANKLLELLPGWQRAYRDETATIFVRTAPSQVIDR
jgi:hypothetical protein